MSSSVTWPLPIPIVCDQRRAARLVAHVRAVGQVVGAEPAGEQLVGERGLVAGPAAGVEDGPVRVGERPQPRRRSAGARRPRRSARSGWRPRRRYIGSVSRPLDSSQWSVCSRRNATECAAKNAASTRLRVASQATALAPFSQNSAWLAVLDGRVGPGAARAVEAVGLVHPQQRLQRPRRPHLRQRVPHRDDDAGQSHGGRLGLDDPQLLVLAPGLAHCVYNNRSDMSESWASTTNANDTRESARPAHPSRLAKRRTVRISATFVAFSSRFRAIITNLESVPTRRARGQ